MNNTSTVEISKLSMKYTPIIDSRLLLSADIEYPAVIVQNNPYSSFYISKQYEESSQDFMFNAQNILYPNTLNDYISSYYKLTLDHYALNQSFKIVYNKNNLLSILLSRKVVTNSTPQYLAVSYTNNLITGGQLRLCELFSILDYVKELRDYIINMIKTDDKLYVDNYESIVESYFNEKSFYLTNNGITIYYPVNSLISDNKTIPVFDISYDNLRNILKFRL